MVWRTLLCVSVMSFLLTACARDDVTSATINDLGLLIIPESERPQGPSLEGTTLDGKAFSLKDLRGSTVIINAFASWCPPCQEEMPRIVSAANRHPEVAFVGLDVNDIDEAAIGFLASVGAEFPVIRDTDGSLMARFTANALRGLPITFIVDGEGRIAGRILGEATTGNLEKAITALSGKL